MGDGGPGMRLRWLGRLLAPGWGTCGRCGTPWRFVRERAVPYAERGAMRMCQFAVCVKCWDAADVYERLAYHWRVTERWGEVDEIWLDVLDSVLAESGHVPTGKVT